ncbi:MAG: dTDP-4-dehydrorhamnose reductase [bacterium]|nr:dTDP-4-dehydrorhamnose reductase [bacterium]
MRVLVTGSSGQLGKAVVEVFFKNDIDVYPIPHSRLDITNRQAVEEIIRAYLPEIVINCSAFTDVDLCEREKDKAYKINALGPRNLALVSEKYNTYLIHISTDYVFDGEKKTPYIEFDKPNPINIYGKSKLEGENFIERFSKRYTIVRTSWLYGDGNNFVRKIIEKAKKEKVLKVVDDQFGSPTYTYDLATALLNIAKEEVYGLYHCANKGVTSRFEEARFIIEKLRLGVEVIPIKSEDYITPAKRPRYTPLENYLLELEGIFYARSWELAMEEFLRGEVL